MTQTADAEFEHWLEQQSRRSVDFMLRSVSAVDLVKERPGFGQMMRPVRGSVLASPVPAAYDPDPDYFFHWFRDSALVIDAVRLAADMRLIEREAAIRHFADFIHFSLAAQKLDGGTVDLEAQRERTTPEFRQYLRETGELAAVRGATVVAESRIHPDGTLDFTRWARPQFDGPPLRALAVLRWLARGDLDAESRRQAQTLLRADLIFTAQHWHEPSFDIWEDDLGQHYYPQRLALAALTATVKLADVDGALRDGCRHAAESIAIALDNFRDAHAGYICSRHPRSERDMGKLLDISVILAVIHSGSQEAVHSVHDPQMQATLGQLEAAFERRYSKQAKRPQSAGTALGRYVGDRYFDGQAWYLATLAAAEFCFRAAAKSDDADTWRARGDGWLATVRAYTPEDGALSEQFDPANGAQVSAKHLTWSYAAFISAVAARRALNPVA